MPWKPARPCRHSGCNNLSNNQLPYCDEHIGEAVKAKDKYRKSYAKRGYDSRWQKARKGYLAKHLLCCECEKHGRITSATVVDHIIPHRGVQTLFWDQNNWQPLCKPCHDKKTGRYESNQNKRKTYGY